MAGRGSESEASAPNYFSCLVEVLHVQLPSANEDCYSSSAISSPQSILKPAKDLVGAISFLQMLVNAGRCSTSAVNTMQRLLKTGKCLVVGLCSPRAAKSF